MRKRTVYNGLVSDHFSSPMTALNFKNKNTVHTYCLGVGTLSNLALKSLETVFYSLGFFY